MKNSIVLYTLLLLTVSSCTMFDSREMSVDEAVQTAVAQTQVINDTIATAVEKTQAARPTDKPTATETLLPTYTFTLEPTFTFTSTPTTAAPVNFLPTPSCPLQSQILLGNRTGTTAVFTLIGPASFYFTVQPDVANILKVCEGCYDVYLNSTACGESSGEFVGRICDGFDGWFYCTSDP
jgi:hypothetical protein